MLAGVHVELEPMRLEYVDELFRAGSSPELWRWTVARIRTRDDMQRYVESALSDVAAGSAIAYVTRIRDGEIVGSTRFGNIDRGNDRVEIGWTWIAPDWQRTVVNTETKYLMLAHAFEEMACQRVELKTDALNERSRAAILRLGATEEGTLRSHMRTESGRRRDTVYYSILQDEWPAIKRQLEERLSSHGTR